MFTKRSMAVMAITAAVNADAGIFSVFDQDGNGQIVPTEVYSTYKDMDTKADNKLERSEMQKAMDDKLRAFCGFVPASADEIAEMDNEKKLLTFAMHANLGYSMEDKRNF